jgi:hypothetical protein
MSSERTSEGLRLVFAQLTVSPATIEERAAEILA